MWLRLRNIGEKKKRCLFFPPPWEFQTTVCASRAPDSFLLRDPRLLINLPRNWLSHTLAFSWLWFDVRSVKVAQSCPPVCHPRGSTVHGILQARILEWVAFPFSRGSSQLKDQTQISHIAEGFFTVWVTRKPKNIGVGSLSLLQGIFLTQESNLGLLYCKRILYQLSYEGTNI